MRKIILKFGKIIGLMIPKQDDFIGVKLSPLRPPPSKKKWYHYFYPRYILLLDGVQGEDSGVANPSSITLSDATVAPGSVVRISVPKYSINNEEQLYRFDVTPDTENANSMIKRGGNDFRWIDIVVPSIACVLTVSIWYVRKSDQKQCVTPKTATITVNSSYNTVPDIIPASPGTIQGDNTITDTSIHTYQIPTDKSLGSDGLTWSIDYSYSDIDPIDFCVSGDYKFHIRCKSGLPSGTIILHCQTRNSFGYSPPQNKVITVDT